VINGAAEVLRLVDPPSHAVALISGGLDSATMAFALRAQGTRLTAVSVDYGQRHRKELHAARALAAYLDAPHEIIDLHALGTRLTSCALTDATVVVPDGHYTDESMRATVVANRNAIMLDVATAIAVACDADAVAFAAHAGDHPVYPDCRPEFVQAYTAMVRCANEGFVSPGFRVVAPFLSLSKADIVTVGYRLGVPFELTWSCYKGKEIHCGLCGTCVERREAFEVAGVADPTTYVKTPA
jgi:7-cyano-7-deazaguanine synthase